MREIKAVLYAENAMDYYKKLPKLPDTIKVVPCLTEEEAVREMPDSQVLCCTGMFYPKKVFEGGSELEMLHSISVGMEPLLCPEVIESPVIITNSRGANAKPVAEHALALILAFSRNIHLSVRAQQQKIWDRINLRKGIEIERLTLGIIGLGAIGEELAVRANGLGMRVLATRRTVQSTSDQVNPYSFINYIYPIDKLHYMLEESDFVVVALPLTNETRGLIGEKELQNMKPTAYLINISRGQVIGEEALVKALQERRIAGAGLDVFHTHPLPETSPLWEMPQVIITPYIAASSPHTMERAMHIFADNLIRLSQGQSLRNVVQKHAGY